jgi:glycosyltransferase involved in cell wall biosynthesis
VVYSAGQPYYSFPRGTPDWRAVPWMTTQREHNNVTVVTAGRLRSRCIRLPSWDRYVLKQHTEDLRNATNGHGTSHRILYVTHPMFWPYVEHLHDGMLIYHADDAFSLMPGWTTDMALMEARLVAHADLVLASSQAMARLLPDDGPQKARIFPNAVDAPAYLQASKEPCPADLQAIPHPRIGFTGSINLKVNLSLIAQLASERPDWHWVLVGAPGEKSDIIYPETYNYVEGLAACRNLKNVHLLGPKPIWHVARYMAHMDVNTLCYRHEPGHWWTAIYPLKLHEYLAAGQPVVTTDFETIRPFSSVLAIARSPQEWAEAITTALQNGGVGTKQERQAVALANTWECRIDQLVHWIAEVRKHTVCR